MRPIDYLEPLPIRDAAAPLSSVLPTLREGTPIAFAEGAGWRMVRPGDALSLPSNRQLCDVPSRPLETLGVSDTIELSVLTGRDVWGATKGSSLVGRVEVTRVLRALAATRDEDDEDALRVVARDRLMPKLLHDLSNALTVAQAVPSGGRDPMEQAADQAVRHAGSLVTHMRVLYGASTSEPERTWALASLVGAITPMLRTAASPADLEVRVETSARVHLVRWRLESALLNLVLNASEHAPSVHVSLRDDAEGHVVLEVEDDGPGFPDANEPAPRRTGSIRGHGLASIRRQVHAMGGRMEKDRSSRGGALVRIRLPPSA